MYIKARVMLKQPSLKSRIQRILADFAKSESQCKRRESDLAKSGRIGNLGIALVFIYTAFCLLVVCTLFSDNESVCVAKKVRHETP